MTSTDWQKMSSYVGLYIRSDALDPDEVTRILGATPTKSWKKGEVFHSKSGGLKRKSGLWCIFVEKGEDSIIDHFRDLLNRISFRGDLLKHIPNVESAEFSVFACGTPDADGDHSVEFVIPAELWAEIATFGVPVAFHIGSTPD